MQEAKSIYYVGYMDRNGEEQYCSVEAYTQAQAVAIIYQSIDDEAFIFHCECMITKAATASVRYQ